MARLDTFIVNSDFPMPAQVLPVQNSTINIPAGTSTREFSSNIPVGDSAIFRTSIKSARAGVTFVGSNQTVVKVGNDIYICGVGVSSAGYAKLRVYVLSSGTSSAETITFTISSFKMP